ncbi:TolC family protein [Marinomonas fungiae]|uniref:Outer membrane protein TolC n=1 Tax=Marinomonas fungiae TaxID=1137284 RepID=A0A0K6II54_9GAMM|nr:TolC family protein [Marinomonas fungiae]CUB02784.1 Outer membrane protein TolC [Marinomonas fungiae]
MRVPFKPQLIALLVSSSLASAVMAEEANTTSSELVLTTGFVSAFKLAKEHDPQLKYAFYNYQAEQEQDDIAMSQLLPNASLSASYTKQDVDDYFTQNRTNSVGDPVQGFAENPARYAGTQDYSVYQLNVRQSLINVAAWQAYGSAKDAVQQSQYTYTRAEQELIYRLSQAYLEALTAAQQVYIYQEKLESLQLKLDQTARMNELGVGNRLNVLRATSSRDVAKSDLLQAKSQLDDAITNLENLTGNKISIPEDWVKNGHQVFPQLVGGSTEEWVAKVQNNAEILAEMANVRSKEGEASSSQSQHLPTLDLSLSYMDRISDDMYDDSTNYTASVELNIPIYSGGRISAQARQAEAAYNAAQARYEQTLSDKTQAIKLAFTQISSYRERLQALEESRKSSQAFLEAAERQADLSLGSQVDVLEARTELYDVRLEFVKTLSNYLTADLNLLLETGQLNEQTLARYDQLLDNNTHL